MTSAKETAEKIVDSLASALSATGYYQLSKMPVLQGAVVDAIAAAIRRRHGG